MPITGGGGGIISYVASSTQNPLQLFGSNLAGWWRADVGVSTSGPNVTSVADQSGNGNALTNTNNVPFDATGFNGKPTFSFLTANSAALSATSVPMGTGSVGAAFIVGQMLTATANFGGAVVYGTTSDDFSATGSAALITRNSTVNQIETNSANFAGSAIDTAISLATNYRLGILIDGSNLTQYVNNVAGSTVAELGSRFWIDAGTIVVGNRFLSGAVATSNPWEGPISEIVIVKSDITSQLTALDNWFKSNWGLS